MSPIHSTTLAITLLACSGPAELAPPESEQRAPRAAAVERGGQVQDLPAPGGTVWARVPIRPAEGRDFATYWQPEIRDGNGTVLYVDTQGFPARFNVYWAWGPGPRLWVYNTDDGGTWIYTEGPEGWGRSAWQSDGGLAPPTEILARQTP